MELNFKKTELISLLKSFCLITGVRVVIFSNDGNEILSYPEKGHSFCLEMQKNCSFAEACEKSNHKYFSKARESNDIQVYHCHAGLVEISIPLIANNQVIGYAMLGQITDIKEYKELEKSVLSKTKKYKTPLSDKLKDIMFLSEDKIQACSNLLNACVSYILANQLITYKKDTLLNNIDNYINQHLDTVTPIDISFEFGISRTSLYNLFKEVYKSGVSEYILSIKIKHAKNLIIQNKLKIHEIATLCGFNDYNYFTKVFKNKTGLSPREFKKQSISN